MLGEKKGSDLSMQFSLILQKENNRADWVR